MQQGFNSDTLSSNMLETGEKIEVWTNMRWKLEGRITQKGVDKNRGKWTWCSGVQLESTSWRLQRQEHHWRHEAQDQHEAQHETQQCVQRFTTLGEHVSMRVVLQSSQSVSVFLLSHSSLDCRTLAQDVCVCDSFHPMVITMSHAWVERSLWLPRLFHQLHFPPSSVSSSTSSCPSSSLRFSSKSPVHSRQGDGF